MTFSYTHDPKNNPVDKVRFSVGDTIEDKHLVDDEEIEAVLLENSNDNNITCAIICDAIAAKFARESEVRVSSYTSVKNTVYQKYKDLAASFRKTAINTNSAGFISGALTTADKQMNEEDDSLVKPFFKRGLLDHPEVSNPPGSGSDKDLA